MCSGLSDWADGGADRNGNSHNVSRTGLDGAVGDRGGAAGDSLDGSGKDSRCGIKGSDISRVGSRWLR